MPTVTFTVATTSHPTTHHRAQRQFNRSQHALDSFDDLASSSQHSSIKMPSSHRNHPSMLNFYKEKQKENHQQKSNQQARYQKLQQLESMKRSQLDQLNLKVRNLIDKITFDQSPRQSLVNQHSIRQHIITDHLSHGDSTNLQYCQLQSRITLSDVLSDSQEMSDSTLIKHVALAQNIIGIKNKQEDQLTKIRHKYTISKQKDSTRAKTESNIETNRKQSRLTTKYEEMKENIESMSKYLAAKRDINEDINHHHKKLDNYNQKRINLLKQHRQKAQPLLQNTSHFNNCDSGEVKNSQEQVQKINSLFESDLFDNLAFPDSGLPTADFRHRQDNNDLNRFLKNVIAQVKLDCQFRQAKKWFKKIASHSKWKHLASILKENQVYFDNNSIHQIFDLQEEQDCPFYSPRQTDYTIEELVHSFLKSQENWFSSIAKQYSSIGLQYDGFEEHKLDLTGKGYISISDLIRFINTEMDVQYRSRDLHLIYQRLKSREQLYFNDIMDIVCQ